MGTVCYFLGKKTIIQALIRHFSRKIDGGKRPCPPTAAEMTLDAFSGL